MALMNESRLMPMVEEQWVRAMASHRLVPGDVMVLHKGRALCDMVLLRGACLVTESMLSGEVSNSRPVFDSNILACTPLPLAPLPGTHPQQNTPVYLYKCLCSLQAWACILQAEQLRKSGYVPEGTKEYDPDWHRSCTIYAGSMVQQVQQPAPVCISVPCT